MRLLTNGFPSYRATNGHPGPGNAFSVAVSGPGRLTTTGPTDRQLDHAQPLLMVAIVIPSQCCPSATLSLLIKKASITLFEVKFDTIPTLGNSDFVGLNFRCGQTTEFIGIYFGYSVSLPEVDQDLGTMDPILVSESLLMQIYAAKCTSQTHHCFSSNSTPPNFNYCKDTISLTKIYTQL